MIRSTLRLSMAVGLALILLAPAEATGQAETTPAPRPEDVASVDAIVAATYDVISGPAGQERDWDRFRSLFIPGARLIPSGKRPDGTSVHQVLTVEDFVTRAGQSFVQSGFFEREIGRIQEQYGNIVHLMSAYDSKRSASDATPFARGINSFQLLNDGKRWWVVTIFWQGETPDTPIPSRFLNK